MSKEKRPRIALEMTPHDWLLEGLAAAAFLFLLVVPAVYYADLPDTIPQHFNARGEADDFGPKVRLWLLPGLGVLIYAKMTILNRYPHIFNYTVPITADNAERQYRMATQLIRVLKVFVMSLFAYLIWGTIQIATSRAETLSEWLLWFMLGANSAILVWYLVRAYRKK
ncbi:MAG: DUF1648 domain-containing protein [Lewinellaceae bacterium]|nr:DUF1648 domain-containing protein [Lewinellaceae bacterium]